MSYVEALKNLMMRCLSASGLWKIPYSPSGVLCVGRFIIEIPLRIRVEGDPFAVIVTSLVPNSDVLGVFFAAVASRPVVQLGYCREA